MAARLESVRPVPSSMARHDEVRPGSEIRVFRVRDERPRVRRISARDEDGALRVRDVREGFVGVAME